MEKYQKRIRILGQSSFAIGILILVFAVLRFDVISIAFGIVFILLGKSIKNNPGPNKKIHVIISTVLAIILVLTIAYPVFLLRETELFGIVAFASLIYLILPLILLIEGLIAWHAVGALKRNEGISTSL